MVLHRFLGVLKEHNILFGILIFGIFGMIGDILSDLKMPDYAAWIRSLGLILLILFAIYNIYMARILKVPIMFIEEKDRHTYRMMFNSFIQTTNLDRAVELLESKSQLEINDLIIPLTNNPRLSNNQQDWIKAWKALIKEWEQEIDHKLKEESISRYISYYHVVPQVILPLSFALGASVNMRRSLAIYHRQAEQYYQVINLMNPRELLNVPVDLPSKPQVIPENPDILPQVNKLILHIFISARHQLSFEKHPDHPNAANAGIVYDFDLDPEKDWLPYVQLIVQMARPLISRYKEIEICLICPSAIAFALGMAFSRNPNITVCHWFADNQYRPVFPLSEIERQLPFS